MSEGWKELKAKRPVPRILLRLEYQSRCNVVEVLRECKIEGQYGGSGVRIEASSWV